jgi:hypothetical protein
MDGVIGLEGPPIGFEGRFVAMLVDDFVVLQLPTGSRVPRRPRFADL